MSHKAASLKNPYFIIQPYPKLCQIWNGPLNEIWLTLLCETMTYFTTAQNMVLQPPQRFASCRDDSFGLWRDSYYSTHVEHDSWKLSHMFFSLYCSFGSLSTNMHKQFPPPIKIILVSSAHKIEMASNTGCINFWYLWNITLLGKFII